MLIVFQHVALGGGSTVASLWVFLWQFFNVTSLSYSRYCRNDVEERNESLV
jgi:hypothetical protein